MNCSDLTVQEMLSLLDAHYSYIATSRKGAPRESQRSHYLGLKNAFVFILTDGYRNDLDLIVDESGKHSITGTH